MSATPDAIVRQWFQQVWDEGREEAIDRLAHPQAVMHGLGSSPMRGTADFKKMFHVFREALGDLEIAVDHTVTQGDRCAAHCRVKGRHVGHALGGSPTDRRVEFTGIVIAEVRDGRVVESWNCFDFLTMYQQIGWVKNPPVP